MHFSEPQATGAMVTHDCPACSPTVTVIPPPLDLPRFREGQLVTLKSGSPPLTVSDVDIKDDTVLVTWFSGADAAGIRLPSACFDPVER